MTKLLRERDIEVDKTFQNIKEKYKNASWEIDILAVNGNEIVVVEVKITFNQKGSKIYK